MLVQPRDADRAGHVTPERFRAYNPLSLTVRSGDLSDRSDRAEYVHNVYGSWRKIARNDRYFGE